jgi:hypothetical protein
MDSVSLVRGRNDLGQGSVPGLVSDCFSGCIQATQMQVHGRLNCGFDKKNSLVLRAETRWVRFEQEEHRLVLAIHPEDVAKARRFAHRPGKKVTVVLEGTRQPRSESTSAEAIDVLHIE